MAMFSYNPKLGKQNTGSADEDNWTAKTDESPFEGKLVVTHKKTDAETGKKTEEKYVVDGFKNKTGCEFDEKTLWYSFDYNQGNFHIIQDESVEIKIECDGGRKISLYEKLKDISTRIDDIDEIKTIIRIVPRAHKVHGGIGCAKNHKWICKRSKSNEYEYLMSFNRLWCDVDGDITHIHNSFGQAQFMCYPIAHKQINLFPGKFELMYPNSAEDGACNSKARHLVYNAPYSIHDYVEVIVKGFAEFIELCEELCKEDKKTT